MDGTALGDGGSVYIGGSSSGFEIVPPGAASVAGAIAPAAAVTPAPFVVGGGGAGGGSTADIMAALAGNVSGAAIITTPVATAVPGATVTGAAAPGAASVGAGLLVATAPATVAISGAAAGEDATFERRVTDLVNVERAKYGLGAVTYEARLDAAAEGHANVMGAVARMAHDGLGDGDPGARARAAGWTRSWGENVAVGQTSPEQVMVEWMASPGHRRNILDPTFTRLGVSYATGVDGRPYWAQEFGA